MVMKKMGIPARANGEDNSITRPAASRPALVTDRTMYVLLETEIRPLCCLGSDSRYGWKTRLAQELWQTMEHSMGVMLMLRKMC